MSGEVKALKNVSNINSKQEFLQPKCSFLIPALRILLINAIMESDFDYACSAWYPNLAKKF